MSLDSKDIFNRYSHQFAARYIYESGEVSVLTILSDLTVAQEELDNNLNHANDLLKIDVSFPSDNHPLYASVIEFYVRTSNNGVWKRCKSLKLVVGAGTTVGGVTSFEFTGQTYEVLDTISSSKVFDSIPFSSQAVEVINNRVWLGNNIEYFPSDPIDISIAFDEDFVDRNKLSNYQFNGTTLVEEYPISYLRYSSDYNRRVKGFEALPKAKPFANDSQYRAGIVLYDEWLRTRGVEVNTSFQTGNFSYPIYGAFNIAFNTVPSWAKYWRLAITKCLNKDYTTEGYASDYFWILDDVNETRKKQLDDKTVASVKYFVLDISGMIRNGYTYTFQDGDMCNINLDTTAEADSSVNVKNIINLKVLGQVDNFIYLEYTEQVGVATIDSYGANNKTQVYRMFFEIYSPSAEVDNTIYYEIGQFYDTFPQTIDVSINDTDSVVGDVVFQNIPVLGYTSTNPVPADDAYIEDKELDNEYFVLIRKVDGTKRGSTWNRQVGKALIEFDPNQEQFNSPSKFRHSGKYIQGTNINLISSFDFADEGEVPYENGAITSLVRTSKTQEDGTVLLAICERETTSIYINEAIISGTGGDAFTGANTSVIGTVRNLKGGYGTTSKRSVVQYGGMVRYWDNIKKKVIRYGQNGLTPISDVYMRSYFNKKNAKAVAFYNPLDSQYIIGFVGENFMTVYSDKRGRWLCDVDMTIDCGEVRGNLPSVFSNTSMYELERIASSSYAVLLGNQRTPEITYMGNYPFSQVLFNLKVYMNNAIADYANANNVKDPLIEIEITNENGQRTLVLERNFLLEHKTLFAHILRDINSVGGVIDGDHIDGQYNRMKITFNDNTQELQLLNVLLESKESIGNLS